MLDNHSFDIRQSDAFAMQYIQLMRRCCFALHVLHPYPFFTQPFQIMHLLMRPSSLAIIGSPQAVTNSVQVFRL